MILIKKRLTSIAILFFAALAAVALWYSPILFKGYAPDSVNDQIVLARNLESSEIYGMYNDHGVLLASDMMKENGEVSSIGNKLTANLYSRFFGFFGFLDWNSHVLISAIIHGLALFIFALTVFYMFGAKTAIIFSFVYALLPMQWRTVYALGNYEFALFFLSLFFIFFILGKDRKYKIIYLFISGIFLVLAALSKEAFLLLIPVLFLYLLFRRKKLLAPVFAAVLIMLSVFYLPGFLKGDNIYKDVLFSSKPEKEFDFSMAGHLFPDYYTFRFDKENFLEEYKTVKKGEQGILKSLAIKKAAANVGEKDINFFERLAVGGYLFMGHLAKFASLEELGGPFILALILLGLFYLRKRNDFLFHFFIWWFAGTIFLLSFAVLAGRNHLMDFGWALALLAALGIIYLAEIFESYFDWNRKKEIAAFFLLCAITGYGLLLVDHVVWGKAYDGSMLKVRAYADVVSTENVPSEDMVATGLRSDANLTLNFLTDKSLIVFRPSTFEKLLDNGKLQEVFLEFNIKYILGYSDNLSQRIVAETNVKNISSDSIVVEPLAISPAKSWFMNMVK